MNKPIPNSQKARRAPSRAATSARRRATSTPCWRRSRPPRSTRCSAETMPASIRQDVPLAMGAGLTETEALAEVKRIAGRNRVLTSLIGQGYYGTILPAVILRNILENPAWYTPYTPYQPEISQGRLEAMLNFQTMIADLTGARHRQRLAARRIDRRGGGDGGGAPRVAGRGRPRSSSMPDVPSADARGDPNPRRPHGLDARRRRSRHGSGRPTRCSARCSSIPTRPAASATSARPRSAGQGQGRDRRRSPPTCWR